MELPIELRSEIENRLGNMNIKDLQRDAENISFRYRNESGKGKRLLTKSSEALSYALVRMPATYTAIYTALKHTFELYDKKIETVLDVGAGTGAGSWAASSLLEVNKITCLEREEVMSNLGKSLMNNAQDECLKKAEWKCFDLQNDDIVDFADLVICSYVLNEIEESERNNILEKLWNATKKVLIIIEPGTPVGFKEIRELRSKLINLNGTIIAPCPNNGECPMPEDDWCNTACRVARSKLHRLLKNGDVPYEDEKFSYISVCKENVDRARIARVLRHPKIASGRIEMKICSENGVEDLNITKKDKEAFKVARKIKCGDSWVL